MQNLIDRFISYVVLDTQSDPTSTKTPSTVKQHKLANLLVKELKAIGMTEVVKDRNGYVMATLESNISQHVPTIGFVSHYDTTPDFTGENVKPQIVSNYNGGEILLNEELDIVLSPKYFKDLLQYKGQTLITTDGTTLLGADDKAGLTEIVTAMEFLVQNPDIAHGKIRVCFTPDEEIGRGAKKFDVKKFGADWAYTMDGSQIGELEYENFNAASAKITFKGKSVHPGYAKNKMINSMLIANEFIAKLPKNDIPEKTKGYEGFYHVHHFNGSIEETVVELIIRDFENKDFKNRKDFIHDLAKNFNKKFKKQFGGNVIETEIVDQYYNMKEMIKPVMHIVDLAERAMKKCDVKPIIKPIRGGTDGSQLSFMGLPCPNIFAGGHNFHGKYEYVPVESMQKAVEVIVKIVELNASLEIAALHKLAIKESKHSEMAVASDVIIIENPTLQKKGKKKSKK